MIRDEANWKLFQNNTDFKILQFQNGFANLIVLDLDQLVQSDYNRWGILNPPDPDDIDRQTFSSWYIERMYTEPVLANTLEIIDG